MTTESRTSNQHTEGPWTAGGFAVYAADSRTLVAHTGICGNRLSGLQNEINARLIAAAPELLALAQQYASECAECGGTGNSGNFDVGDEHCGDCAGIRALIERATKL